MSLNFFTLSTLYFFFLTMTKETMIGMLRAARNGAEMIQVLDSLAGGYEYIESPQIAQVLGVPTLEAVEF